MNNVPIKVALMIDYRNAAFEIMADYIIQFASNQFTFEKIVDAGLSDEETKRIGEEFDVIFVFPAGRYARTMKNRFHHWKGKRILHASVPRDAPTLLRETTKGELNFVACEYDDRRKLLPILPFGVDTDIFKPMGVRKDGKIKIGWVGFVNNAEDGFGIIRPLSLKKDIDFVPYGTIDGGGIKMGVPHYILPYIYGIMLFHTA